MYLPMMLRTTYEGLGLSQATRSVMSGLAGMDVRERERKRRRERDCFRSDRGRDMLRRASPGSTTVRLPV